MEGRRKFGPSTLFQIVRVLPLVIAAYPAWSLMADGNPAGLWIVVVFGAIAAGSWIAGTVYFVLNEAGIRRTTLFSRDFYEWETLRAVERVEAKSASRWFDHWEVLGRRGRPLFRVPWTLGDRIEFFRMISDELASSSPRLFDHRSGAGDADTGPAGTMGARCA